MANRLKMAKRLCVLELHRQGWSFRRIARELGVHRETVAAHVRLAVSTAKPAKALTGSDPPGSGLPEAPRDPNPATADEAPTGVPGAGADADVPPEGLGRDLHSSRPEVGPEDGPEVGSEGEVGATVARPMGAGSRCAAHRELITAMLGRGLSAVRIHADLRDEHGVELSYHSVRRFVAALGRATPDPFRRMECEPGAEVQVDFGSGPTITVDGRRRRTHVLRVVLSHSRKGYSEAVLRQDAESFIRALENAFRSFGGVPRTVVVDNLKAAVLKADWFDPDLNPKIVAFARHHGTVILPTKPHTPRHKGKVERGVAYVKDSGLKGREFTTLAAINEHLLRWETTVADRRVHGTTRRQVGEHFESVERAALLPLPAGRFPCFREARRRVHRDSHVEVAKAYYSVPPEHVGRDVWARWDGRVVRILDMRLTQIAVHAQCDPGRFSTQGGHIADRKISSVERGAAYLISRARLIGRHAEQWAAQVVEHRGVEGIRTIAGLRPLAERHPVAQLERACKVAAGHGAHRLRDLRRLMQAAEQASEQQSFEFLSEDPLIRPLEEYQRLAGRAFQRGPAVATR